MPCKKKYKKIYLGKPKQKPAFYYVGKGKGDYKRKK